MADSKHNNPPGSAREKRSEEEERHHSSKEDDGSDDDARSKTPQPKKTNGGGHSSSRKGPTSDRSHDSSRSNRSHRDDGEKKGKSSSGRYKEGSIEYIKEENEKLQDEVRYLRDRLRTTEKQLKMYQRDQDSGSSDTPRGEKMFGTTAVTKGFACFPCKRVMEGKREKMRLIVISTKGLIIAKQYSEEVEHEFPWQVIQGWTVSDQTKRITFNITPNLKTPTVKLFYTYQVSEPTEVVQALANMIAKLSGQPTTPPPAKGGKLWKFLSDIVGPPDKPAHPAQAPPAPLPADDAGKSAPAN